MESRFRKVVSKIAEGWKAGADKPEPPTDPNSERFVMKPGEVQIIRGGGARVDRQPGEPRG